MALAELEQDRWSRASRRSQTGDDVERQLAELKSKAGLLFPRPRSRCRFRPDSGVPAPAGGQSASGRRLSARTRDVSRDMRRARVACRSSPGTIWPCGPCWRTSHEHGWIPAGTSVSGTMRSTMHEVAIRSQRRYRRGGRGCSSASTTTCNGSHSSGARWSRDRAGGRDPGGGARGWHARGWRKDRASERLYPRPGGPARVGQHRR